MGGGGKKRSNLKLAEHFIAVLQQFNEFNNTGA